MERGFDTLQHLVGCTENPNGAWVAQQARNLVWSLTERPSPLRFLIHDRDSKLTGAFDEVFRTEGISIIRTPVKAPKANAFAERFVGTMRRECLDWVLIFSRRQLERVLAIYIEHYNGHRPHRGLGLVPPERRPALRLVEAHEARRVRRRARLGGLINEYSVAA
jgi:transposase InsO family protein